MYGISLTYVYCVLNLYVVGEQTLPTCGQLTCTCNASRHSWMSNRTVILLLSWVKCSYHVRFQILQGNFGDWCAYQATYLLRKAIFQIVSCSSVSRKFFFLSKSARRSTYGQLWLRLLLRFSDHQPQSIFLSLELNLSFKLIHANKVK